MDRAIEADRGDDGTEQADHRGGAVGVPASSVGKLGPHGLRIGGGSEGPERDEDGDHSEDVEDQQQPFHQGQLLCQHGVEEDGEGGDRDDEQSSLPCRRHVARVVENDQALDDCAGQEGDGGDGALPASEAQPTHDVRQELLSPGRGEF